MKCILGVDGGGTKTTVQIVDCSGKLITENKSGSSNYKSVGVEKAKININNAVLGAIRNLKATDKVIFKSACFGLSGNDSKEDKNIYHKIIFNNKIKKYINSTKTIICNDTRIGLAAGVNSKNGIMIICGTGSKCFGVNEEGKEAKANGWDYILGYEGSGYNIGIKALRTIMREYDERGESTILSKNILEDLNIRDISELIKWAYSEPFSKEKIAAVTETVCKTAKMGDRISIKILEDEANEAVISVEAVSNKLNLPNKEFDLVFVGSVFKCEKYFKAIFIKGYKKDAFINI